MSMKSVYSSVSKIPRASGRSDYLSNPNRQEEVVLHQSSMSYTWKEHAQFEKEHQKTKKGNNEALEVMFLLPNELYEQGEIDEVKEICDKVVDRILGKGHDYEYAVHWNHARTSFHCHVMFSERENQTELKPKLYKRDIWYNHETQRIARAGSPDAELIHRKGEVQRDADGNIKYDGDLFTPKDTRFKSISFIHRKNEVVQEVLKEHGFSLELHMKDGPFMPQRKLYKGASEDYLNAARAYNDAVNQYNETIREGLKVKPEQDMSELIALKRVTLDHVKRANHDARRITKKSVEEILKSVKYMQTDLFAEAVYQPQMTEITVTVPAENIAGANGIYALRLREGFIFFQPYELRRSENGVEIMLEKDAVYTVNSDDDRQRYTGEELNDIIQADLEMPQQRQTQRQRQMDDDFEL